MRARGWGLMGLGVGVEVLVWCCCVVVHEPSRGTSQVRLAPRRGLRPVRATSRTDPAGSKVRTGWGGGGGRAGAGVGGRRGLFVLWGVGGGGSLVVVLRSGRDFQARARLVDFRCRRQFFSSNTEQSDRNVGSKEKE